MLDASSITGIAFSDSVRSDTYSLGYGASNKLAATRTFRVRYTVLTRNGSNRSAEITCPMNGIVAFLANAHNVRTDEIHLKSARFIRD